MKEIFLMRCGKSGYSLEEAAEGALLEILERESADVESFGNARGVRNLFEKAIAAQADRLSAGDTEINKESLMCLTRADLLAAVGVKEADQSGCGQDSAELAEGSSDRADGDL